MTYDRPTGDPSVPAQATSGDGEAQLPAEDGVYEDVSGLSISADRLGGASRATANTGEQTDRVIRPEEAGGLSESEIMLRVGAGDDAAFALLVEKYKRPMVAFMFRSVHTQAIAEELAQEVFMRVYRARQSYKADAKFSTWLYRIATNLAVNHARDTKSERSAPMLNLDEPDEQSGSYPDVADATLNVEQRILGQERLRAIRKTVMDLPERQRLAVLMHKFQGLDYKEIGAVLHLSESATKSLLFRAYETLRDRLKAFV